MQICQRGAVCDCVDMVRKALDTECAFRFFGGGIEEGPEF